MESGGSEKFVPKKWPQLLAASIAYIGVFEFGLLQGWPSPGIPDLQKDGKFGSLSDDQLSWIGSISSLACFFSVYPSGYLIQKLGRKFTMFLVAPLTVLGILLMAFATNIEMFYSGRFIGGLSTGVFAVAVPAYVAEIATDDIRGSLGSAFQMVCVMGILGAYVVGAFVSWKWFTLICAIPAVVGLVLLFLIPESPRYLIGKNEDDKAKSSLMWLRAASSFEEVEHEFKMIQDSVDNNNEKVVTFKDFLAPEILKPVGMVLASMVCMQFCGIDAVTFYTVQIFASAGSDIDPNLSAIYVGIVQVIFSGIAVYMVERSGRRPLLLISNVVMIAGLVGMGAFFQLQADDESKVESLGWLPLVSLMVYMAAYNMGIGPIGWLALGEMLPNHVIGATSALATSVLFILSFLITRFFENINKELGNAAAFWFFSAATTFFTIFFFFYLPETKGKSLDEIQEFYVGNKKKNIPTK